MEPTEHEIDARFWIHAESIEQALVALQRVLMHMPREEALSLGMRDVTIAVPVGPPEPAVEHLMLDVPDQFFGRN
jgi:hypothetical protein